MMGFIPFVDFPIGFVLQLVVSSIDGFLFLAGLKLIFVGPHHQKFFHDSIMPSTPQISTIIFH